MPSISIHAPRVGSDIILFYNTIAKVDFNPRSPCGERPNQRSNNPKILRFQSTLPVWGATVTWCQSAHKYQVFQSTLPVWGATIYGLRTGSCTGISIHAPRVGSDNTRSFELQTKRPFQSTLPVWGATNHRTEKDQPKQISIHAPRVGSDGAIIKISIGVPNFNPRSPCGERPALRVFIFGSDRFQSTLPVWGATAKMHRFFFCIFGKKGIFCDILQIGRHLQGIGRKRRGDFLSRSVRTSRGKYGYLAFAFRESGGLRENRRFYSQSVLFSFRIDCQGSRIAGCPFRGP